MNLDIRPIAYEREMFAPLLAEAAEEGGPFLFRLRDEWESGALRFDAAGEFLLGAFLDGALVGVAGLSHDPYHPAPGRGRVRHVYVMARHRSRGIGRRLVERAVEGARANFDHLRLATRRAEAAALYESMGFVRAEGPHQTHLLRFTRQRL